MRMTFVLLALSVLFGGGLGDLAGADERTPQERQVDDALARSLRFLAEQQKQSGAWALDDNGESTAGTSLAVMSFMACGHVPGEGPYGQAIERGIRWVIENQQDNGMLVTRHGTGPMYSHGISTLMLAEAAGMVSDADAPAVRRALERAIKLILTSQAVKKDSRQRGGWRYQTNSTDSDLSVTGWQVMSLRAAKDIGCDIPKEAIDDAVDYVKKCSTNDNRGFGYQPGSHQSETMTGTGIVCLEVCGENETREAIGGADYLLDRPIRANSNFFYYGVYYTSVGMFKIGGDYSERYRTHMIDLLLPLQNQDGSWKPEHGSERGAGKIYATSMSVLALAIEYRYLPIYQR
ncbi:MAG: prenyltransferase/squalene oxidase repeat-containing protein [Planctomycetaceae bacterium]